MVQRQVTLVTGSTPDLLNQGLQFNKKGERKAPNNRVIFQIFTEQAKATWKLQLLPSGTICDLDSPAPRPSTGGAWQVQRQASALQGRAAHLHGDPGTRWATLSSQASAGLPDGDRGERPLVYVRKLPQHHGCRRENPIGVQKGIEEIDTKKPQVCQSLQEALHAGITDLGHFAGVECFTEANVSVILVKTGIRPTHKAGT